MNAPWRNNQTREIFLYVAMDAWAPDPAAVAREWLESMCFDDACEHLAKQLKIDIGGEGYRSGCGDSLMKALIAPAWRKIDWLQVARQLLRTFGPTEEATASDDEGTAAAS